MRGTEKRSRIHQIINPVKANIAEIPNLEIRGMPVSGFLISYLIKVNFLTSCVALVTLIEMTFVELRIGREGHNNARLKNDS